MTSEALLTLKDLRVLRLIQEVTWVLVYRLLLEKISDGILFYDRSHWQLLLCYSVRVTNHCLNCPNAGWSLGY